MDIKTLWSYRGLIMGVYKESKTFQITYSGEKEAIKTHDFSKSLSGVHGAIKEAYHLLNGNPTTEITTTFFELGYCAPGLRSFSVCVVAEHDTKNKVSLETILKHLGFLGQD
jgi:hypothetical protein